MSERPYMEIDTEEWHSTCHWKTTILTTPGLPTRLKPCGLKNLVTIDTGSTTYRFFVKPLAINDIVRGQQADPDSDIVWFSERLEWSRHSTVRIIAFSDDDEILATLSDMGCSYERLGQIIAIDIPDDKLVEQAHAFLTGKQISGALDLEEACLPDSFLD